MRKGITVGLMAAAVAAFAATAALADSDYEYGKQMPALIKAMPQAKVSLADGIKDAEKEGTAISAQYEVDDGKYQLSVFVSKGADIEEVIVDYATGAIKSAEALVDPDDIKDAKKQVSAMEKTKQSLANAVDQAVKANAGYEAIRVVPRLSGGKVTASVTLLKGSETKKVTESMD